MFLCVRLSVCVCVLSSNQLLTDKTKVKVKFFVFFFSNPPLYVLLAFGSSILNSCFIFSIWFYFNLFFSVNKFGLNSCRHFSQTHMMNTKKKFHSNSTIVCRDRFHFMIMMWKFWFAIFFNKNLTLFWILLFSRFFFEKIYVTNHHLIIVVFL